MVEIGPGSVAAAHQGGFPFVEFGVADADIALLQAYQYVPATVGEVTKGGVDGPQITRRVNNDRRHSAIGNGAELFGHVGIRSLDSMGYTQPLPTEPESFGVDIQRG